MFYDEECTNPVTKDATDRPIPGMNSNGIITTGTNGYADLGTLAGTYYLREIATNDGYIMLTAPVKINVEKGDNTEKVTASCTQEGVIFSTQDWITKGEDDIWVVKVNNSSGVELPATGGPGTILMCLAGTVLAELSFFGMLLWYRRRKAR